MQPAECTRLLDHYTELLIRQERPEASPEQVARKQEEARALGRRETLFEVGECEKHVSRRQYECAMAAPTVDDVERCLVL